MFIAALFTIAWTWKQPKCPSAEAWINKIWCVCEYIYIKWNFTQPQKRIRYQINLETLKTVMQNEVSQKEKNKYYTTSLVCGIQKYSRNEHIFQNRSRDREKENKCLGTKGKGACGINLEIEIDIYALVCVKWITKANLLYSTRNCTQGSVMICMERKSKKEWIY